MLLFSRFLKILQIIVQEPGASFKRFLPSIINICIEYIYPVLAQVGTIDTHVLPVLGHIFPFLQQVYFHSPYFQTL
ncbi:hypothetical protein DPMN_036163 [Dreissena polymorpha]|uniref:Uncharacterized protein n=1 Tax=Dreissena polymorpha TaxID=45954 RepID=A0A9D4RL82_DREPO|nr:hypothetical protein DPMN_036163 [Dreissena polymorpha]